MHESKLTSHNSLSALGAFLPFYAGVRCPLPGGSDKSQ